MNKESNKIFNSFNIESNRSENISIEFPEKNDQGLFRMREWQKEAFEKLKSASYMILSAPMGSGKSSMMCYLSSFRMQQDNQRRCIICVPQEMIGSGFAGLKYFEMPNGQVHKWGVENNLCLPMNDKKGGRLIQWLQCAGGSQAQRTVLCTHATLVSVFKQLKSSGREGLLKNLLIWIDEAHHVLNALSEASDAVVSNGIGSLVHFILNQPGADIHLGLTTATPIRGDRYTLLTSDMIERFQRFDLPFDRYLDSCKYLRSFSYQFMVCNRDYISGIGTLLRQRKGRDFIYIPHTISRYSLGDKRMETQRIIEEYAKLYGTNGLREEQDLFVLSCPDGEFKILDLVDDNRKRRRSKKMYVNELKKEPESVNAIISMSMGKEGMDYEPADRIIIVGPRGSLVEIIQMLGRSLRDYPGKSHVEIVHLLPFEVRKEEDELRENLNDVLKAILCSMLLEDVLKPVRIKGRPLRQESTNPEAKEPSESIRPLVELIPDPQKRIETLNEIFVHYLELQAKCESSGIPPSSMYTEFQNRVSQVLEARQIESNLEQISAKAWKMFHERVCPAVMAKGLDVENIKFDAIEGIQSLDGLLLYLSQICGLNTFSDLRKAIDASKALLSEESIVSWIKQHITKYRKKPTQKSGIIEFAIGTYEKMTWQDVDNSLKKGLRGLAGNDSLSAFIQRHTGEEPRKTSYRKIPIELARDWVKQYHNKYNDLPSKRTGVIEFAIGDFQDTTWAALDSALRRGGRGLIKISGLTDLTNEVCGISNRKSIPVLTDEEIFLLVQEFMQKHGKKPHCNSGKVERIQGLEWKNIHEQLYRRGSSLSRYIQQKFGIRARNIPHSLSLPTVQEWILKYVDKYKKPPGARSQIYVEFSTEKISWGVVHSEIKKGRCGLPKGSSLADLVKLTLESRISE